MRTLAALALLLLAAAGVVWWSLRAGAGVGGTTAELAAPERQAAPSGSADARDRIEPVGGTPGRSALARGDEPPADELGTPGARAGIVLAGRVLDLGLDLDPARAAPAGGVPVRARRGGWAGFGHEDLAEGQTDEDGAFRLVADDDGARPIELEVWAEGDLGFQPARAACRLADEEVACPALELARVPYSGLAGRTVDALGRPLAGVEVTLLAWNEAGEAVDRAVGSAVSALDGHFRVDPAPEFQEIAVRASGLRLLAGQRPERDAQGRWEFCELVLGPEASLRVRVEDAAGEPVAGVLVQVGISPTETHGELRSWRSLRSDRRARTDAGGLAALDGVWAGQRLVIHLSLPSDDGPSVPLGRFERVREGRALLDEGDERMDGRPLVLDAGEERTVAVALAGRLRIAGRVTTADGEGFPEPWLVVSRVDEPQRERLGGGRGDAEGRFDLEVVPDRPLARVLVVAADRGGFLGLDRPGRVAWQLVELGGRAEGAVEVDLVMQATLAIAGEVRAGETGARAAIRCIPLDRSLPFGRLPTGAHPLSQTKTDGAFRIEGLLPGRYDLEVTPFDDPPRTWVRGVEAGTEDLVVELAGERPVRVTIEVAAMPGATLAETVLLRAGPLVPFGAEPDAPALARDAVYREPFGWVPWLLTLWTGAGGHTDATGELLARLTAMKANPTTWTLDEGLYWLGAKAKLADGTLTFPIGTGLVRLAAGEHRLRFELPAAGALRGRVVGAREGAELFVALAHADGRPIPLDVGRGDASPLVELGFDGRFRLATAPAGRLELRVGTREELLGGSWTRRQEIRVAPGGTTEVEIELGRRDR
jgi:hypothetical protein